MLARDIERGRGRGREVWLRHDRTGSGHIHGSIQPSSRLCSPKRYAAEGLKKPKRRCFGIIIIVGGVAWALVSQDREAAPGEHAVESRLLIGRYASAAGLSEHSASNEIISREGVGVHCAWIEHAVGARSSCMNRWAELRG